MRALASPEQDRLSTQLGKLEAYHRAHPGVWLTLSEAAYRTGASEAGVSARYRDLRKRGWTVTMRKRKAHLNEYTAVAPGIPAQLELV